VKSTKRQSKQAVRVTATICPAHLQADLLTLKVVSESRVTWATPVPISILLSLSVLDLGLMYATDVRRASSLNAPCPKGRGMGRGIITILIVVAGFRRIRKLRVIPSEYNVQETQLSLTNLRDVFIGQSKSPNIVPFHMLDMVSYCAIVTLSLRRAVFTIFDFKNVVTLKLGSEVTQDH